MPKSRARSAAERTERRGTSSALLAYLNAEFLRRHQAYEDLFWEFHMGAHGKQGALQKALRLRDAFAADPEMLALVDDALATATPAEAKRLARWKRYFERYQQSDALKHQKEHIDEAEKQVQTRMTTRTEGYEINGAFVEASENRMRMEMRTNPVEAIRKACFAAGEKLALENAADLVKLVAMRNRFAKEAGYEDFYAYKVMHEEGMEKAELFAIFDEIYEKTKFAFQNIRAKEKEIPGLRKPWNFGYLLSGGFTKEEDPYFQFGKALTYWGETFARLGIDFRGGTLVFDLLDRKGKHNNGFCHWPGIVRYEGKKRVPGRAQLTATAIPGQVGSGSLGLETLFHECGHAAHLLNFDLEDACIGHEYPPMSTGWAETHSMFLDTVAASIEWRVRYAKNAEGKEYPFELYERKVRELNLLRPLGLMSIMAVMYLEKALYEERNLTEEKAVQIAKKVYKKCFDRSEDSAYLLTIPHLYSFQSAAAYHGYGLAELALTQWRRYFYKKYGAIVDNPKVGKEMQAVWKLGSELTFPEFVKMATGAKLSPKAYLQDATAKVPVILKRANERIKALPKASKIPADKINARIKIVSGKKLVADNSKGFAAMAKRYEAWLSKQK